MSVEDEFSFPPPKQKQAKCIKEKRLQKVASDPIVLSCDQVIKGDDLTLYIERDTFLTVVNNALGSEKICPSFIPHTIDLSGTVNVAGKTLQNARLHAALGFGCKYYSVTIRSKSGGSGIWNPGIPPIKQAGKYSSQEWDSWTDFLKIRSLVHNDWNPPESGGKFLTHRCAVADILYRTIFPKVGADAGLVLITGATGSGKTTVLNGILMRYLAQINFTPVPERRPHVIAVGDPVETIFYPRGFAGVTTGAKPSMQNGKEKLELENASLEESAKCQQDNSLSRPIDFTARILGTDVSSVEHALEDALRETPSVYVISELRQNRDFAATLNFAATGQLIFATAHSTSLIDALRKLMVISGKTDSPNTRSLLAQRLKAIVHLRKISLGADSQGEKIIVLPTIWLGNSSGVRSFVCDGLASVLPHGATGKEPEGTLGTRGLAWAAQKLVDDSLVAANHRDDLLRAAHELDLRIR